MLDGRPARPRQQCRRVAQIADQRTARLSQQRHRSVARGVSSELFRAVDAVARIPGALAQGKGAIVNVTSIAGHIVHPFAGSAYSTSKAALSALTREMAAEFARLGVRVNAVAPGEIKTAMLSPETTILLPRIPLHRLGDPEDVAGTISFCAATTRLMSPGPRFSSTVDSTICEASVRALARIVPLRQALFPDSGRFEDIMTMLTRRSVLKTAALARLPSRHLLCAAPCGRETVLRLLGSLGPDGDGPSGAALPGMGGEGKGRHHCRFHHLQWRQGPADHGGRGAGEIRPRRHCRFISWYATGQADNLEPVDDVVTARSSRRTASPTKAAEYLGKADGHWIAVPTGYGSTLSPPCARIDLMKQLSGLDVTKMYPAGAPPDQQLADNWTWDVLSRGRRKMLQGRDTRSACR